MGFRFRRSFGVLPGVRINVGRRGPSVSLGVRGAHMTLGPSGIRNTVGIPGTGMSYTTSQSWNAAGSHGAPATRSAAPGAAPVPTTQRGSALGWVVAGILFVILVAVLASH